MKTFILLALMISAALPLMAQDQENLSIEAPVNLYGSGRYGNRLPDQHIPFGVHWTQAEPSDFIWIPFSTMGGTVGTAVGNVIGWPCKAVYSLCKQRFTMEDYVPPLEFAQEYFGIPFAYLVGSPFWGIKKAFVDFPCWLFGSDDDDE